MIGGKGILLQENTTPTPTININDLKPAPQIPEVRLDPIKQMEASILTLLNLNRIPVYSKTYAMFENMFESLDIETIEENIDFLSSYGIIPPLENREMTGGVAMERPKRLGKPSPRAILGDEYKQGLKETARLAKEARLIANQQAIINEQKRLEVAEWHRQNLLGFNPASYTPVTLPEMYLQASENIVGNNSASKLFETIMPPMVVKKWKFELEHNCRDVYEPSSPETQCNNTIGPFVDQKCYICGFDILPEQGPPAFFYRTCEHILPIIQAVFFLDLYRGSQRNTLTVDEMDILKLEYSWAHQSCNMVKSDDSYLCTVLDGKFPTWVYSQNNIRNILINIANSIAYNPGSDIVQSKISSYPGGYETWLNNRTKSIVDNQMKPIQTYLNKNAQPGLLMMIGLGNLMNTSKWSDLFSETYREVMSATPSSQETIPTTPYQELLEAPSPPPIILNRTSNTRRKAVSKPAKKFRKKTIKNRINK